MNLKRAFMEGEMYCQNCGNQVEEGKFCSKCGLQAARNQQPSEKEDIPQKANKIGSVISIGQKRRKSFGVALMISAVWYVGIALIIGAIWHLIVQDITLFLTSSFYLISFVSVIAALPSTIILIRLGLQSRQKNKRSLEKNKFAGLEDILLGIAMLFAGIGAFPIWGLQEFMAVYGISLSFVSIPLIVFSFIALISFVLVLILYILRKRNVKVPKRENLFLLAIIVLLSIFIVFYSIIPLNLYSILLMLILILRGCVLLPKRERKVPSVKNVASVNSQDTSSMGYAFLCFFFPLIGLILFLVWKDKFPQKAKSCGKGALFGVISVILIAVIAIIIIVVVLPRFM